MKNFLLFFMMGLMAYQAIFCQETKQFIIKPDEKKLSKQSVNSLKELLGETARDVFKRSIALSKQLGSFHVAIAAKKEVSTLHQELGSWQIEVASLQLHCSDVLEKLIENQKPFKKATKQELQAACTSMQEAYDLLGTLSTQVKTEQKKLETVSEKDSVDIVKNAVLLVQGSVSKTKNVQTSFNTNTCLKLA